MNDSEWRKKIYGPYMDAWKIIMGIKDADQSAGSDDLWQKFIDNVDSFSKAYEGNRFAQDLATFLVGNESFRGAGDIIAKMNQEELK